MAALAGYLGGVTSIPAPTRRPSANSAAAPASQPRHRRSRLPRDASSERRSRTPSRSRPSSGPWPPGRYWLRGPRRELARIRSYFDFCRKTPGFLRILNEAEVFAPSAYHRHVRRFYDGYRRALLRSARIGELKEYPEAEIEVLVFMLMGIRSYLSMMYQYGYIDGRGLPLEKVIEVYSKLLTEGLFRPQTP